MYTSQCRVCFNVQMEVIQMLLQRHESHPFVEWALPILTTGRAGASLEITDEEVGVPSEFAEKRSALVYSLVDQAFREEGLDPVIPLALMALNISIEEVAEPVEYDFIVPDPF